jgi:hypothetical protein
LTRRGRGLCECSRGGQRQNGETESHAADPS